MIKAFRLRQVSVLLCLASSMVLGLSSAAYGQSQAFTVTTMVRPGDPISNGHSFNFCKFCDGFIDGTHGLNDAGQAVISGSFEQFPSSGVCEAVVTAAEHRGTFVANFCNTTEFGKFMAFVGANINNQGQVALNMGPFVDNEFKLMILLYSEGELSKIAAEGDESPAGTIFGGDCGFGPPSINDLGEVAFYGCADPDSQGRVFNGVYEYSGGMLRTVVKSGAPSPLGGTLGLIFSNGEFVSINDAGDVLFSAEQIDENQMGLARFGLFIAKRDGTIEKVELGQDVMPNGSRAAPNSVGLGTINDKGQVAYGLLLSGKPKAGIFLYSGGSTQTVALHGEPSPIGGTLDLVHEVPDPMRRINDSGAVAFMPKVIGGDRPEAIFLASPSAMVEVVGIGDRLPTGEKIRAISSFAVNNNGQVAFFVTHKRDGSDPVGLYLATPVTPSITSAKVKGQTAIPKLVVNGSAFITNDSVIQINGEPVQTEYPSAFKQSGGTTTRLISRDPKLAQLLTAGETVQITVVNSLTARTSEAFSFTP